MLLALNGREVKRRCNFVAIVSRYTKLHRAGRQFVGLCPFHAERTPSFYVDPQRKLFKCFGRCDAGGDVFDFIMRVE
ncbi:MAG: CHC2 zinc finger domain-containing protein, partial [Candidatus Acidiferrales bacterium]